MRLSRDDILKAEDSAPVEVDCPEWGGSVLVRGMTGKERDAWEVSLSDEASRTMSVQRGGRSRVQPAVNLVNVRAKLVARCCVDDEGERLFTDADVAALGEKSAAPIDRIFLVAARLCGIGDEDMEVAAVNFGATGPGGGSSSPSPATSGRPPKGSSPR